VNFSDLRLWLMVLALWVPMVPCLLAAKPGATQTFAETLAAGKAGDPRAQFNLGLYYMNGEGVAQDASAAVSWYVKSAVQGNAKAQNNLGICCATGNGTKLDPAQAITWWLKSAGQGNGNAACGLGRAYATGSGAPKDLVQSIFWYRRSAALGYPPAQLELAWAYTRGEGVTKDLTEAAKLYRLAAVGGNVIAQSTLGAAYATGLGVSKNAQEAVKWYIKAAQGQDADAQKALGDAYGKGEGVSRDYVLAYAYLSLASPYLESAQQSLAELSKKMSPNEVATGKLRYGELLKKIGQPPLPAAPIPVRIANASGLPVNPYRQAAEQGDPLAQTNLGVCYATGRGELQDVVEGVKWYRKAADQGFARAQANVGAAYASGVGVAKDDFEAVKWYRKSANQGYVIAQSLLGACYSSGRGVAVDDAEAFAWFNLAGMTSESARRGMSLLEARISPANRLKGLRRAQEIRVEIDAKGPSGTKDGFDRLEQSRKAKEAELMRKGA
jgi:TPR repeat protein